MKGGEHMDIGTMGLTSVAAITVICYLVGQAVKATDVDNKWIPIIVGTVGGVLGVAGMLLAVPLAAAAYQMLREDVRRRNLPAEEPPETEP